MAISPPPISHATQKMGREGREEKQLFFRLSSPLKHIMHFLEPHKAILEQKTKQKSQQL